MSRFTDLLKRFRKDERGAFAVIFGLLALVLIATSGAVVDFTSLEQARTRAQTAIDAAALALQPTMAALPAGTRNATLKVKAQAILTERLNDAAITATVTTITTNTTEGSLEIAATLTKNTMFVGLIGIPNINVKLISQATRKQLDLEVAMVLDNSISMNSSNRMTNLKKAARCAANVLYNAIAACDDTTLNNSDSLAPTNTAVRIGIVPFTEFVNVGSGNKLKTWITQDGATTRSKDNFDNDDDYQTPFNTTVNRFSLYTAIGQTWSGCVEDRNHTTGAGGLYYDTSDLEPDPTIPDSLFVPVFAPDEAGSGANSYLNDAPAACPATPVYKQTQVKTKCNTNATTASQYNGATCSGGTTTDTYTQTVGGVTTTVTSTIPTQLLHINKSASSTDTYSSATVGSGTYKYTMTRVKTWTYTPFPDRVLQERLCKYVASNTVSLPGGFQDGPNADCGVAIQPLTTTKSSIISKIGAMGPDGGTNIHQGVIWGFHMLSPSEPLTEGKSYISATSKVMIVMTDGENTTSSAGMSASTAPNTITDWTGGEWYLAYGYPYSRRLDTNGTTGTTWSALQTEMDNRTKTSCANAKAAGIIVYTIGLTVSGTSNPTAVTAMLTNCATDSAHAFFPAASTDLVTTFQSIAGQLADLRLAK